MYVNKGNILFPYRSSCLFLVLPLIVSQNLSTLNPPPRQDRSFFTANEIRFICGGKTLPVRMIPLLNAQAEIKSRNANVARNRFHTGPVGCMTRKFFHKQCKKTGFSHPSKMLFSALYEIHTVMVCIRILDHSRDTSV